LDLSNSALLISIGESTRVLQDVSEFGLCVDVRYCNLGVKTAEQIELLEN
jgi:hypothetical protein